MYLDPGRTRVCGNVYPIYKGGLAVNISRQVLRLSSHSRDSTTVPRDNHPCRDLVPLPRIVSTYIKFSATDGGIRKRCRTLLRGLNTRFAVLERIPPRSVQGTNKRILTRNVQQLHTKRIIQGPKSSKRCKGVRLFWTGRMDPLQNYRCQLSPVGGVSRVI